VNARATNPMELLLRDEIASRGPLRFDRFMDLALYHPALGYYGRQRDPFGKEGDYYTAEQLQPVFGILIATAIRSFRSELDDPKEFTVVELGAGRREMSEAFRDFRYIPIDVATNNWPERFTGVVFANEFFDALPVRRFVRTGDEYNESLVGWEKDRGFFFVNGAKASGHALEYLDRYAESREIVEWNERADRMLIDIARRLERGFLIAIDYGYAKAEAIRFPQGTLMSYRHHQAIEDVLRNPGEQDITAHIAFDALIEVAERSGMELVRLESLAQFLLRTGEPDQFASALRAPSADEETRRRLQLKTLLFSMGEMFRVLTLRKRG